MTIYVGSPWEGPIPTPETLAAEKRQEDHVVAFILWATRSERRHTVHALHFDFPRALRALVCEGLAKEDVPANVYSFCLTEKGRAAAKGLKAPLPPQDNWHFLWYWESDE